MTPHRHQGHGGIKPVKTYDDLWNNFVTLREHFMKVYMRYWNEVVACQRDIHPKIMGSILMHDCIENGRPVDNLGCRHNASLPFLTPVPSTSLTASPL